MFHFTSQKMLAGSHPVNIHVIGIGGTGSRMLSMLAEIDFAMRELGHPGGFMVSAFDPDIIEQGNIGRQSYTRHDLGENKAKVLIERINRFYGVNYSSFPTVYCEKALDIAGEPDIVVSCTDTGRSRKEIGDLLTHLRNSVYWLDMGNSHSSGQVILGTVGRFHQPEGGADRLPTILDFDPEIANRDDNEVPSCSLAEALHKQDLFINRTLATYGCDLLWLLFREGRISIHGCFINLTTYVNNPITVKSSHDFFFIPQAEQSSSHVVGGESK